MIRRFYNYQDKKDWRPIAYVLARACRAGLNHFDYRKAAQLMGDTDDYGKTRAARAR